MDGLNMKLHERSLIRRGLVLQRRIKLLLTRKGIFNKLGNPTAIDSRSVAFYPPAKCNTTKINS